MKFVYVAGKYRGKNSNEVFNNILAARRCAEIIAERGDFPVCPHMNGMFMDGIQDDAFWLKGTLELMEKCDVVWAMKGWSASEGARGEIERALELGMPVFYE